MKRRPRRAWAEAQARAADEALLVRRLREMGVRRPVAVHENRTVLVSVGSSGTLRIHRGYAYSPDRILKAVIAFVNPRSRVSWAAAEREIVSFPVDEYVAGTCPRRRVRVSERDRRTLELLRSLHDTLNARHFDGSLSAIPFRISDRMRSSLGEVTIDARTRKPTQIAISRYHLERDASEEIERTLLHEMIHQWQAEAGLVMDHGSSFRRKALQLGVPPLATRVVEPQQTVPHSA